MHRWAEEDFTGGEKDEAASMRASPLSRRGKECPVAWRGTARLVWPSDGEGTREVRRQEEMREEKNGRWLGGKGAVLNRVCWRRGGIASRALPEALCSCAGERSRGIFHEWRRPSRGETKWNRLTSSVFSATFQSSRSGSTTQTGRPQQSPRLKQR
jgi:hypothetical protein